MPIARPRPGKRPARPATNVFRLIPAAEKKEVRRLADEFDLAAYLALPDRTLLLVRERLVRRLGKARAKWNKTGEHADWQQQSEADSAFHRFDDHLLHHRRHLHGRRVREIDLEDRKLAAPPSKGERGTGQAVSG